MLVTGAEGQLGRRLIEAFSGSFDVTACSKKTLNITSADDVRRAFRQIKPNIVVNAAAYTKVDDAEINFEMAEAVNSEAVKNLALNCNLNRSLLIHFSTDYVFDGKNRGPYTEQSHANPLNAYGKSKLLGDQSIVENSENYLIFRLAWVYDSIGTNFPKKILNAAKIRETLSVVRDQFGTPTSATFIAGSLFKFIEKHYQVDNVRFRNIYNLVPNGTASWYDFAVYLVTKLEEAGQTLCCSSQSINAISSDQITQLARRPAAVHLDNTQIQKELGTKFADWKFYVDDFLSDYLERCNEI